MSFEGLEPDGEITVRDLVWRLVFRELSNEEMIQLSHDLIRCSLFDQERRYKVLDTLDEATE